MLTEPQLQAALMVAQDRLSQAAMSRKLGIGLSTLKDWKATEQFRSEVEKLLNLWAEDVEKKGIADKRRRLFRLNDRWRRGQAFMEKRGKLFRKLREVEPLLDMVPGGEDGMVAWTFKTLHLGEKDYEKIVEFKYDTAFQDSMNKIEEQAAIETGQWKPKQEISISGVGGGPIQVSNLSKLSDDELRTLITLARKLELEGPRTGIEAPQPEPDAEPLSLDGPVAPGTLPQAP